MFGLIRTTLFILVAFAAGLFFARAQMADECRAAGGEMVMGVCKGAS